MALIVILLCIGVQRFLNFASAPFRFHWAKPYFHFMNNKISQVTESHGLLGNAILILPIFIIASIFIALIYHLLGLVGYFVLSVLVFWYCIDAKDLSKEEYQETNGDSVILLSYKNLFGFLFWYAIIGPYGLVLYFTVLEIIKVLEAEPNDTYTNLLKEAQLIRRVLDWIPVRLLGFAFALVGHFGNVFKVWMKHISDGLDKETPLLLEYARAALQTQDKLNVNEAIQLIDRSLLVWLVVIALISIGFWLG